MKVGVRTPSEEAERIKRAHGCAATRLVGADETVEVSSIGGRGARWVPRSLISEIIEPRVEEIFAMVEAEIRQSGHRELLASGVVITGGATLLPGTPELAEEILGLPVRCGVPQGVGGLIDVVRAPMYATGVGLILWGLAQRQGRHLRPRRPHLVGRVGRRIGSWLGEIF